jgi:hypothetical protein
MAILVNPHNAQEEKVLIAFLESLNYEYEAEAGDMSRDSFIVQYNQDLQDAERDISNGNFVAQEELESFFAARRKKSDGN